MSSTFLPGYRDLYYGQFDSFKPDRLEQEFKSYYESLLDSAGAGDILPPDHLLTLPLEYLPREPQLRVETERPHPPQPTVQLPAAASTGPPIKRFTCYHCTDHRTFKHKHSLLDHMRRKHSSKIENNSSGGGGHPPPSTSSSSLPVPTSIAIEVNSNPTSTTPTPTYASDLKCGLCSKHFSSSYSLHRHILTHTGGVPPPKEIICKRAECGRKFGSDAELRQHVESTHMEKKYPCRVCSKLFTRVSNLNRHMKLHSNLREYPCKLCGKDFTQRVHRDKHMMIHFRASPDCPKCGSSYAKLKYYSSHIINVCYASQHPDPPDSYMPVQIPLRAHVCPLCGAGHATNKRLQAHVAEDHHITTTCPLCNTKHTKFERMLKHLRACYLGSHPPTTSTAAILGSLQHSGSV